MCVCVCTQICETFPLNMTWCSVFIWLVPSLIVILPLPTGWVISGGDEEDPDHAGHPGERIWEGNIFLCIHNQKELPVLALFYVYFFNISLKELRKQSCFCLSLQLSNMCFVCFVCFSVQVCDCDDGPASVHHWRRVRGQPEGLWTTARYILLLGLLFI